MVVYTDDVALSYASLQTGNIVISGPGGSITATFVGASPNANAASITAEYHFTPPGGAWNAANAGTYSVNLDGTQVSDTAGNYAGASLLGSFVVDPQPLTHVASVQVNNGEAQRSRVTSFLVAFDANVTLPANPADAFQLRRQSDNAVVTLTASMPAANLVTLTFTGGPVAFGSLADGRYTLTVFGAQVNNGLFDGNGDGIPGDDYVLIGTPANGFFRLFGDANGSGNVDATDFGAFRSAFGTANNFFDSDNDGDVDASDFGNFRQRFGVAI